MFVRGEGGCLWEERMDVCGRGGWMCAGGEGGCVWEGRVMCVGGEGGCVRPFVDRGRHLGQHCRMPTLQTSYLYNIKKDRHEGKIVPTVLL